MSSETDRFDRLEEQLAECLARLDAIDATLQRMEQSSIQVRDSCHKMDGHIGFVESCFAPFLSMCRPILRLLR